MIFDLFAAVAKDPADFKPDRVDPNSYSVRQNRTPGSMGFLLLEPENPLPTLQLVG